VKELFVSLIVFASTISLILLVDGCR